MLGSFRLGIFLYTITLWAPINHRRFFRNKTLPSFRNPRIFSLSDFIEFNFDSSFYIVSVTHFRYFNLVKPYFVFHKMKRLARLLCFARLYLKLALTIWCVRVILHILFNRFFPMNFLQSFSTYTSCFCIFILILLQLV